MGSNLHLNKYGNEPQGEGGSGGRGSGNLLARQSSVYSLTFDEFLRGSGKDFGSMNMDELLKNIWSAEESQSMASSGVSGQEASVSGGNLQRQGSLTLTRTLSQKTVDQVWKDISKEYDGGKYVELPDMPRRQPTLGEMTLKDFLVKAGVVREDAQLAAKASNVGVFGDLSHAGNNFGVGFEYQHSNKNTAFLASRNIDNNTNEIAVQPGNLPLNVNGIRSLQQQLGTLQQQQQQPPFPKQPGLSYGAPTAIPTGGQLGSPGMRGGIVGISDPALSTNLVQGAALTGGGMSMVGFGAGGAIGSPAVSSDGLGKSSGDTASISPVPYVFNGGVRGRKGGAVEKVVERRQRRMIKNRESAARSRARKQAYTMELEAEIAKLKEENEELQKKQAEMTEMQKNQVHEMMNLQGGAKRQCLRRTQTGPW